MRRLVGALAVSMAVLAAAPAHAALGPYLRINNDGSTRPNQTYSISWPLPSSFESSDGVGTYERKTGDCTLSVQGIGHSRNGRPPLSQATLGLVADGFRVQRQGTKGKLRWFLGTTSTKGEYLGFAYRRAYGRRYIMWRLLTSAGPGTCATQSKVGRELVAKAVRRVTLASVPSSEP